MKVNIENIFLMLDQIENKTDMISDLNTSLYSFMVRMSFSSIILEEEHHCYLLFMFLFHQCVPVNFLFVLLV